MPKKSFKETVESMLGKFAYFLLYVILEWTLIVMLFIDGLLAFAANEFARFFDLKIPCLLCTRIDHIFVRRNPDFYYNDSICESHRKDVSSLAFCHVHQKLSDIRRLCEGCLLSFATENKFNRETYRSLVGILGADLECSVEEDHKIHLRLPAVGKKVQFEKSSVHCCSCCGEPLRVKASFPNPQAPTPTPRSLESRGVDPLPHIRYTELKSDTESEIPDEDESVCRGGVTAPLLTDASDHEDTCKTPKTPSYIRANRFLNLALSDSTTASPRYPERPFRRLFPEKPEGSTGEQSELTATEQDGEIILSHLKKQVRLDRKSLIALYMELDEERSASAVAANQAMAMITRLQAEKAAMHMEALQYQRMMEEQAEYDQEAIQVMKDLLSKRDEEIKQIEHELKSCKHRLGEEYENSSASQTSECGSSPRNFYEGDEFGNFTRTDSSIIEEDPLMDQESERIYLMERLRVLEKIHASKSGDQSEQLSYSISNLEEECKGEGGNTILTGEISDLSKRMEAIEQDREFLKHAFQSLQRGDEGTQLLKEIALHLRELRHEGSQQFKEMESS